jgi:predicted ABC-type transport system involved in lysophospholipase L1 biosynthesis ATPase subunit
MDNSLKRMSRVSPLRGCDALSVAERSTLDHASAMSPFYLGRRLILFAGHKKYPTAALDKESGRKVMELFRDVVREHQAGVIVVTHDERALDVFHTIYEMEDGVIRKRALAVAS